MSARLNLKHVVDFQNYLLAQPLSTIFVVSGDIDRTHAMLQQLEQKSEDQVYNSPMWAKVHADFFRIVGYYPACFDRLDAKNNIGGKMKGYRVQPFTVPDQLGDTQIWGVQFETDMGTSKVLSILYPGSRHIHDLEKFDAFNIADIMKAAVPGVRFQVAESETLYSVMVRQAEAPSKIAPAAFSTSGIFQLATLIASTRLLGEITNRVISARLIQEVVENPEQALAEVIEASGRLSKRRYGLTDAEFINRTKPATKATVPAQKADQEQLAAHIRKQLNNAVRDPDKFFRDAAVFSVDRQGRAYEGFRPPGVIFK